MVSGWMCGTAWWQWKSNKALLSGSGGMAWGRQTSWLWQASAEGERDCERTDCVKLSIFLCKPASNCQISVYLPPITDNPHQSNDLLDD